MTKRIIVFAPHPDDETLGCGGTIAKRLFEGYDVLIVIMTDGRHAFSKVLNIYTNPAPEELKEIRKEEVKRATKILGVPEENLIFLDFEDGTLNSHEKQVEEKVAEILEKNSHVEVYLPCKQDCHPDHHLTNRVVKKSIQKLGISTQKYHYSITPMCAHIDPIISRFLHCFKRNLVTVDISKFLDIKKAALQEFKSELTAVTSRQHKPVVNGLKRFLKNEETFYLEK